MLTIANPNVASECAFSTGDHILDPFRSSLTPNCVQTLVGIQDWLREETNTISAKENLE